MEVNSFALYTRRGLVAWPPIGLLVAAAASGSRWQSMAADGGRRRPPQGGHERRAVMPADETHAPGDLRASELGHHEATKERRSEKKGCTRRALAARRAAAIVLALGSLVGQSSLIAHRDASLVRRVDIPVCSANSAANDSHNGGHDAANWPAERALAAVGWCKPSAQSSALIRILMQIRGPNNNQDWF